MSEKFKGLIPKTFQRRRYPWGSPERWRGLFPVKMKIIFLGDNNLQKLKGYKSYVELDNNGGIVLTITGLSLKAGDDLFESLEPLKTEEIEGK